MDNRITARLDSDTLERFEAWLEQHSLSRSQAIRIALERLLAKPPSLKEQDFASVPTGAAAHR